VYSAPVSALARTITRGFSRALPSLVCTKQRFYANLPKNIPSTSLPNIKKVDDIYTDPITEKRQRFDPTAILPSDYGEIRILNNTTRDAQQSNLSAEMDHGHRVEIAKMIDDVFKDMPVFPGYEQLWGGTIPMFDLWKRGGPHL